MKNNKLIIRVIAAIVIIVLAGVASYHGSKAIFLHKFEKDQQKAEKEAQEELEQNVNENYISVIRVGKMSAIRILNTETCKLTYALMRPDSDLFSYDEDGNGEEMVKVVNNIQNEYGIQVDSYEDFDQEAFIELINQSDSFECDLPNTMSFKDNNQMTVELEAGPHILNGIQSWGVVAGYGKYESMDAQMENVKAFLESYTKAVLSEKDSEGVAAYADILFSACESDKKAEDVKNYFGHYASMKEINVITFAGKEDGSSFDIDVEAAKAAIEEITAGKTVEEVKITENTEEKTTEKVESKESVTIYIRNAAYINGLAGKWSSKLQDEGYNIGSVDNYDETYDQTIIRVAKKGMGEDLKEYFPDAEIKVGSVEDGADICIYLGKDADTL